MKNKIKQIYDVLFSEYSKQNWWPVTGKNETFPKYTGGPKTYKQKFEVMICAILTQNTSWTNVEKAIVQLNEQDFIDVDKILNIEIDKLARIIKSSRYFNQKAKKLKSLCLFLKKFPITVLQDMDINVARNLLINVKGIGPETADSILLYSLNKPIFVIDAYTKRIFSRIGIVAKEITYEELQKVFHASLQKDSQLYNEYHALIVEHAKRFCKVKPLCEKCPLDGICKKVL